MKDRELGFVNGKVYDKSILMAFPISLCDDLKIEPEKISFRLVVRDNQFLLLGPSLSKPRSSNPSDKREADGNG